MIASATGDDGSWGGISAVALMSSEIAKGE